MTPEAAIYNFLSGFSIPAYASTAVPETAEYPYLTYDLVMGDWYSTDQNMTVNLWYYGNSEAEPNAKAREIGAALSNGGTIINCDDGSLWLSKGDPWCQSVIDEDNAVKRRYLLVNITYLTKGD